jgi:uncharacterized phage-like protein YoqJ
MRTVCGTGHRPDKVLDTFEAYEASLASFEKLGAQQAITGMAAGFDLIFATAAIDAGLKLTCAMPYRGHKTRKDSRAVFETVLENADEIVYVTNYEDYTGAWVYQKRNEWMVDHAGSVVAYWDGSSGGTANCIKYARKQGRPIWHIVPITGNGDWYA